MSSDRDQARLLAERIARRVSQGDGTQTRSARVESRTDVGEELSVMRDSLEELQQRLARIESHVTSKSVETSPQAESGGNRAEEMESGTATRREAGGRTFNAPPASAGSPWLSGMYVPAAAAHPSQERFGVEEAAVSELVDFFEGAKKCELEPGGKPCDHCAMCNTRGF